MRGRDAGTAVGPVVSSSTSYLKIALIVGPPPVILSRPERSEGTATDPYRINGSFGVYAPQDDSAALIVALILLLVRRQRRVFERDFVAGLQTLHDLDAGVVGQAGDDGALLEPLLPRVLVVLL